MPWSSAAAPFQAVGLMFAAPGASGPFAAPMPGVGKVDFVSGSPVLY